MIVVIWIEMIIETIIETIIVTMINQDKKTDIISKIHIKGINID
jgi:hypothetical protein